MTSTLVARHRAAMAGLLNRLNRYNRSILTLSFGIGTAVYVTLSGQPVTRVAVASAVIAGATAVGVWAARTIHGTALARTKEVTAAVGAVLQVANPLIQTGHIDRGQLVPMVLQALAAYSVLQVGNHVYDTAPLGAPAVSDPSGPTGGHASGALTPGVYAALAPRAPVPAADTTATPTPDSRS